MSTDKQTPLKKTVLVTGAARRIGRTIALALAQNGWDVVVHYARSAAEAQATVADIIALGQGAIALQCDLNDEAAVKTLLDRAAAQLGPISCVVNNASLFGLRQRDRFFDSNAGCAYAYQSGRSHTAGASAAPGHAGRRASSSREFAGSETV